MCGSRPLPDAWIISRGNGASAAKSCAARNFVSRAATCSRSFRLVRKLLDFDPPNTSGRIEFDDIAEKARKLGFKKVVAGPFVRSSYHADEMI